MFTFNFLISYKEEYSHNTVNALISSFFTLIHIFRKLLFKHFITQVLSCLHRASYNLKNVYFNKRAIKFFISIKLNELRMIFLFFLMGKNPKHALMGFVVASP